MKPIKFTTKISLFPVKRASKTYHYANIKIINDEITKKVCTETKGVPVEVIIKPIDISNLADSLFGQRKGKSKK